MHKCVLLIFGDSILRHTKSMDVHHPYSEVVGITVNPDKSRPCISHRRLRLILSDWTTFEISYVSE